MKLANLLLLALVVALAVPVAKSAEEVRGAVSSVALSVKVSTFTDQYCSDCHNKVDRNGDLDLTSLKFSPADPTNFAKWVKIHDRLEAHEMPPKDRDRPAAEDAAAFLNEITSALNSYEQANDARIGRSTQRRLNRSEYENALRDLLQAPWLQIKDQLPEDGDAYHFNRLAARWMSPMCTWRAT